MHIRNAAAGDVDEIQQLIQRFATEGLMLPRTAKSLYENLQCFSVVETEGQIVGTAGLQVLWKDLAEIRSLAVSPSYQGQGIGRMLVERVIQQARDMQVKQVLSLTYQTAFFDKLGFRVVDKESLPHKIWKDCIFCKKFAHCDEVAMVYYTPSASPVHV